MKDFISILIGGVIELNVCTFSLVESRALNGHGNEVTLYFSFFSLFIFITCSMVVPNPCPLYK